MEHHRCAICGTECEELEPAFRRPDAVFAVPREERELRVKASEDFVSIDDAAFFIRCVAPIPVIGREQPYSWGFWVRVSAEHFQEYERFFSIDPPADHPGFPGALANQTRLLPPTLGMPAHVVLGQGASRPRLMLLGEDHPLAQQQARGITPAEVHALSEWCAAHAPDRPHLDPPAPPFSTTLEEHGWLVVEPRQVGRPLALVDAPPRPGDLVKAPFVFLASDARGQVVQRLELMWVLLDEVRPDGGWSGTLANAPFVPGPIGCGSRVWLDASHVLALDRKAA